MPAPGGSTHPRTDPPQCLRCRTLMRCPPGHTVARCSGLAVPRSREASWSARIAFRRPVRGPDARRNVVVAVPAAPAQNISRVLAAPTVNDLWRHFELTAMFTAITYERSKIIDKLCGGVVSNVRGAGKCFVVDRPARGDCPGKACGSYPFPLTEILMYSRNIVWTVARGKPGTHQAPPSDSNIHGLHQWLRTRRLPVDAYHFGLVDCLVQVIALDSVALGGEYHGSLPARAPKNAQDIEPVERVLDLIVIPGEVGDHHVESQSVADRALHCLLVLGDPHCGVWHGLTEKRFDDLSQRGRHQKTWPLLHPPAPQLDRQLNRSQRASHRDCSPASAVGVHSVRPDLFGLAGPGDRRLRRS